ncbi:hypothetical protein M413DRAFT_161374 [Hebeloma cylindrosporum]|uniref:Uncharacterized protein n=1 Tax=Hebeloma cylindrosporum TaxID=76867 RepID=A0A0C2Y0J5_HEBCY|nr:hypothetical protein M413DRAFT_161374 [Hebeloma cylindrosporum h7]
MVSFEGGTGDVTGSLLRTDIKRPYTGFRRFSRRSMIDHPIETTHRVPSCPIDHPLVRR